MNLALTGGSMFAKRLMLYMVTLSGCMGGGYALTSIAVDGGPMLAAQCVAAVFLIALALAGLEHAMIAPCDQRLHGGRTRTKNRQHEHDHDTHAAYGDPSISGPTIEHGDGGRVDSWSIEWRPKEAQQEAESGGKGPKR